MEKQQEVLMLDLTQETKCDQLDHQIKDEGNEITNGNFNRGTMLWRALNCLMASFFAMAAYVQLNDPDPIVWMFVYSVPACLCISSAFAPEVQDHTVWQSLATADIIGSLAGAIYLAVAIHPQMQRDSINNPLSLEEGREMAGLLIVMFWMALSKALSWYNQRNGNFPLLLWIFIIALFVGPILLWAFCYRSLDKNTLPQHCKDML